MKPPLTRPPPRGIGTREGLFLLALLPGLGASLWMAPATGDALLRLGLALGLALAIEGLAQRCRGLAPLRIDEALAALAIALLVLVLLPATAPLWSLGLALAVALLLGRHAYGGHGQSLFHPAALGLATVLGLLPPPAASAEPPQAVALAWAAGGLLLLALRLRDGRVPLAVLAAALLPGLGAALLSADGGRDLFDVFDPLTQPTLLLLAFFLASDPASGCLTPRGRWLFGAGVGLLAMLLPAGAGSPAAAVSALLLMNAAAPLLDAVLRRRPGAVPLLP